MESHIHEQFYVLRESYCLFSCHICRQWWNLPVYNTVCSSVNMWEQCATDEKRKYVSGKTLSAALCEKNVAVVVQSRKCPPLWRKKKRVIFHGILNPGLHSRSPVHYHCTVFLCLYAVTSSSAVNFNALKKKNCLKQVHLPGVSLNSFQNSHMAAF